MRASVNFGKFLLVFFHSRLCQQYLRGIFVAEGLREYQMCPYIRINACFYSLEPGEQKLVTVNENALVILCFQVLFGAQL